MKNWAYNYFVFKLESGTSIKDSIRLDILNKVGADGWELVSINAIGQSYLMYTFKKPAEDQGNETFFPTPQEEAKAERSKQKSRSGSLREIQVERQQPQQAQPQQARELNLQDILNSILGGDK